MRRVPCGGAIEITRPPPVTLYQHYMGGVDRCMQHRAKNPIGRPSKKYWKFLFNFILEVCVINAFIIWQETPGIVKPRKQYSLLDFRCDLAEQLVGGYSGRALHRSARGQGHTCERLDRKRSTCKWCPKHEAKKRRETVFGCVTCGVHLCQGGCFEAYHHQCSLPTN